jgi:hypothetical protein
MHEFLTWVGWRPRTYSEAMDAWRSSCPRYTLWEDALAAELICVDNTGRAALDASPVRLTPQGQAMLAQLGAAR